MNPHEITVRHAERAIRAYSEPISRWDDPGIVQLVMRTAARLTMRGEPATLASITLSELVTQATLDAMVEITSIEDAED